MSIPDSTSFALDPIDQAAFSQLDYQVMSHAFQCQNSLGRLCDEVVYQNDLVARLQAAGLSAVKESPVTISHRDFAKTYWLDLVVANAVIYELKTSIALVGAHDAQLLNYLFLCRTHHGKLINFRPARVESRFVNTTLTQSDRRTFSIEMESWKERDQTEQFFRENLLSMLNDWGCGLDLALYLEALVHFGGGEERVVQLLPLTRGQVDLGTQRFQMVNSETAFRITALSKGLAEYEQHLRSLLSLSPLRTMQWVNLGSQKVRLYSLTK